jgi:hypothetical protein
MALSFTGPPTSPRLPRLEGQTASAGMVLALLLLLLEEEEEVVVVEAGLEEEREMVQSVHRQTLTAGMTMRTKGTMVKMTMKTGTMTLSVVRRLSLTIHPTRAMETWRGRLGHRRSTCTPSPRR